MTYVKPTNYKLIDRAARYILILRPQTSYEEAVRAIYHLKDSLGPDEPIVLKVIKYLEDKKWLIYAQTVKYINMSDSVLIEGSGNKTVNLLLIWLLDNFNRLLFIDVPAKR